MKCLIYLLLCSAAISETNYVYYMTTDNRPLQVAQTCSYDIETKSVKLGEIAMSGIDWNLVRVAIFTDKIPKPFTNVSQVTATQYLPMSEPEKASRAAALQITPAVKALMDLINETRPATNKITEARLISVVTNKIESMKAVAVEESK